MTTYEKLRLLVVILTAYAIPFGFVWYIIDRKIKAVEDQITREADYLYSLLISTEKEITNINTKLRNIK